MFSPEIISQILLGFFLGIIAGIFTGLTPGIHINTLAFFIVSSLGWLSKYFQPLPLAGFIASMSITHTFIDFIPSIFLGSPDEDTSLSVLPGHSMLLKGKGHHAVMYTLYRGLLGLAVMLLFTPIFVYLLPKAYPYIKQVMFFILFFASCYLLVREEKITLAFLIFIMSGMIGLATFSLPVKESLLPMLTGLFGASSLITSLAKKQAIPKQKVLRFKFNINKKDLAKIAGSASFASSLCSFLPALGSSQAAVISSDITKDQSKESFLFLLGAINTIVMGLSIVCLYTLNVERTGSAAAIAKILPKFLWSGASNLATLIIVMFFSGIISFFLAKRISKYFASHIHNINYRRLSLFVLLFLFAVVIAFSGFFGFLIFLTSTFLGLYAIQVGARRTLLMGCLMLPAILLYFPL